MNADLPNRWPSAIMLAAVLLSACAQAPKPLRGDFHSSAAHQALDTGAAVRWGGTIIAVVPEATRTCFEILARPLDAVARPRWQGVPEGRFIACRERFYDPAIFESGRDITVTGRLRGHETGKVGNYPYRYPVVEAETVYLWSERVPDHGYRWSGVVHLVPGSWGARLIRW